MCLLRFELLGASIDRVESYVRFAMGSYLPVCLSHGLRNSSKQRSILVSYILFKIGECVSRFNNCGPSAGAFLYVPRLLGNTRAQIQNPWPERGGILVGVLVIDTKSKGMRNHVQNFSSQGAVLLQPRTVYIY